MSKRYMSYGLLLSCTVAALSYASANAQTMAPPDMPPPSADNDYPASPYTSTEPGVAQQHVLGTLRATPPTPNNINTGYAHVVPNMAPPPMTMPPGQGGMMMPPAAPNGMAPPPPLPPSAQSPADSYESLKPMQSGDVRYVTGGIGDDERDAMKGLESQYDLHILSASKSGAFAGDTQIKISSAKGEVILSTVAGPIFFADLPNGHYTLEAMNDGQTKRQPLVISHGKPAKVHLSW